MCGFFFAQLNWCNHRFAFKGTPQLLVQEHKFTKSLSRWNDFLFLQISQMSPSSGINKWYENYKFVPRVWCLRWVLNITLFCVFWEHWTSSVEQLQPMTWTHALCGIFSLARHTCRDTKGRNSLLFMLPTAETVLTFRVNWRSWKHNE